MKTEFKQASEVFLWMESFTNLEKRRFYPAREYRLDRMEVLLKLAGNPQNDLQIYHIAGSKGKGSTAAFLSSCLHEAGFRTGVFTSPHLYDYRERISLACGFFPEAAYVEAGNVLAGLLKSANLPDGEATTFELLTTMAFMIFKNQGCSRVVLETGLGGRLDATNTVRPKAVLLTTIEKEHTEILGDTLQAIATEKAGIMKKGIPAYWLPGADEVMEVFQNKCRELPCPGLSFNDMNFKMTKDFTGFFLDCKFWKMEKSQEIQYMNAALVVKVLEDRENIKKEIIEEGLKKTRLKGRFEKINTHPVIILDGAHTPESLKYSLKAWLRQYGEDQVLIFGCVDGKDEKTLTEILAGHFSHVIITRPGTFKVSQPRQIYDTFLKSDRKAVIKLKTEPKEALEAALRAADSEKQILVCGSFYTIAAIGALLRAAPI